MRRLVKNTGVVFGAINEREGALRELIVNSNNTFEATASRDAALAETFRVFPTFLDESKATLARLEGFASDTRPLVNDLKGPADDLGPTVRDLGDLAPDLEAAVPRPRPAGQGRGGRACPTSRRFLRAGEPVFEAAHVFFPELNPILSLANFHQATIAGFISNGGADLTGAQGKGGDRYQTQIGMINPARSTASPARPLRERGNAYLAPNALQPRAVARHASRASTASPRRRAKDPTTTRHARPDRTSAALLRPAEVAVQRQAVQQAREGQGAQRARRRRARPATRRPDPNQR